MADEEKSGARLMEGLLKKKSPKKVLGRSVWQERYFVLQSDRLLYYKSQKQAQDLEAYIGIILLTNIQSAKEHPKSSTPNKWRFNLHFTGSTTRVFELYADNSLTGQKWMMTMLNVLTTVNASNQQVEKPSALDQRRNTKFWKPAQHKLLKKKKRAPVFDQQREENEKEKTKEEAKTGGGVPEEEKAAVLSSFSSCVAFQGLDTEIHQNILSIMCKRKIKDAEAVINRGERTQTLYFVVSGSFVKHEANGNVAEVTEGEIFGELDIMYDQPSSITVTATSEAQCWCLDRYNFKSVLKSFTEDKFKKYKNFLTSTDLLSKLDEKKLVFMAEALEETTFTAGQDVVTQGETGDCFFLLKHGECEVLKDGIKVHHYKTEGDFFGERALLENQTRAATVRATTPVTVLKLDRATFEELLGDLSALLKSAVASQDKVNEKLAAAPQGKFINQRVVAKTNQGILLGTARFEGSTEFSDGEWLGIELDLQLGKNDGTVKGKVYFSCKPNHGIFCRPDNATLESETDDELKKEIRTTLEEKATILLPPPPCEAPPATKAAPSDTGSAFKTLAEKPQKIEAFPLEKLKLVGLLGSGSFGSVTLREHVDTGYTYALKAINKKSIRENGQLEFIKNERAVLAVLDSPFIVKLHGAMVDEKFVYFLLEPAMGGEMFSLLNEYDRFTEDAVRFYTASVVLAFEHMHSQTIVYRDLKPENVMLDHEGYVKITDFGFAKPLKQRTYTFCGTPDYLSPEIVMNQGHSFPTDWWTLGVLMYEMLTGATPFYDDSTQAMYEKIVAGVFPFPPYVSTHARDLVKRFLCKKPTKRLGIINGGVKLIKQHPFFEGFDWDALARRELEAPYKKPITDKFDLSNFDPEEPEDM